MRCQIELSCLKIRSRHVLATSTARIDLLIRSRSAASTSPGEISFGASVIVRQLFLSPIPPGPRAKLSHRSVHDPSKTQSSGNVCNRPHSRTEKYLIDPSSRRSVFSPPGTP